MTYYLTKTSPLVFTTQKAERVKEWMIQDMLELLLKREYELEEPEYAADNINLALQVDSLFREVPQAPRKEPTQEEVQSWAEEVMWFTELGQLLQSQIGEPLHKQTKEETESLNDETVLSNLLESWTPPQDGDHAGPESYSKIMGYDAS
jgi:hypothetical protein